MDDDDVKQRLRLRADFAKGSMLLVFAIVISALWCLTDDSLANRLEKDGPTILVLFGALIAKLCYYFKLGSDETKVFLTKGDTP